MQIRQPILPTIHGRGNCLTHFALLCPDIMAAMQRLEAAGIPLSGGPVRFGPGAQGIFVRDPDRNVIELHQRG